MHQAYEWITSWPALAMYAGMGLAYLLMEYVGLLIRWRHRGECEDRPKDALYEFTCARCGARKHTCRLKPRPDQICLACWGASQLHSKLKKAQATAKTIPQLLGLNAYRDSASAAQRVASASRMIADVHYGSLTFPPFHDPS
jgi:hypothetical protein